MARSVNTAMVHAYWLIGREIVEVEQEGKERADYGEQVVRRLAERLGKRFGKGFSYPSVKRMKQFYLSFPQGSAIPEGLGGYQKGSATLSLSPGSDVIEKGSTLLSQSARHVSTLFPPLLSWSHYLPTEEQLREDEAEHRMAVQRLGSAPVDLEGVEPCIVSVVGRLPLRQESLDQSNSYPQHSGGIDNIATVLAELAEQLDPAALASLAPLSPVPWAQRLGHLLERVGAADKASPLAEHVASVVNETTALVASSPAEGAPYDKRWRLLANVQVEPDL